MADRKPGLRMIGAEIAGAVEPVALHLEHARRIVLLAV